MYITLFLSFAFILYYVTMRIIYSFACMKSRARVGVSKYWEFDSQVVTKKCTPFYKALSNSQRERYLREEVGTRLRTGIAHLSDEALTKLILSFDADARASGELSTKADKVESDKDELIGAYCYDILADPQKQEQFHYIPCYYP